MKDVVDAVEDSIICIWLGNVPNKDEFSRFGSKLFLQLVDLGFSANAATDAVAGFEGSVDDVSANKASGSSDLSLPVSFSICATQLVAHKDKVSGHVESSEFSSGYWIE